MLIIDKLAYTNKFSESNPYIKVWCSILIIVISIVNSNIWIFLVMIFVVSMATVSGAQIPIKIYVKMLIAPIIYLFISILTIILSFGFHEINDVSKFIYLKTFNFMNFYIGITVGSLQRGGTISLRAISSIIGMYFLILTTPCNQQIKVMKKIKIPSVFIEIYVLTYRFIAIFFEEVSQIHLAQKMRFGYNSYKNSMNSLAILIKILFVRIMSRYTSMVNILEIKHFDGTFYVD
ncbi:cobalt/nickel transport system permease protein [Sedimentibacter acidaminivorans]|uniref:Cobalt/nickel transport system permease protein n=1 Tax=Sedimentibacter acidaminivorans TaxID=913099 RepID=A0ABS4GEQ0_9FIRM|nr:cobalt ECF transporter T component CbiQ [Sedimentibacter acidaminivorans]MBP1926171.1 cobalt/nickel transport system permease protein [Sedimentibacter acidaminivorans]